MGIASKNFNRLEGLKTGSKPREVEATGNNSTGQHKIGYFVNFVMCRHLWILPSPIEISSKICALYEGHSNTFCKRPLLIDIVFCEIRITIKLYVPISRHYEEILMIAPHTTFKALQRGLFVYGV